MLDRGENMPEIQWLHISDLHFNDKDMSSMRLREELPAFLGKNGVRCDYVFCTGDIRTAPGKFLPAAADYLKHLCQSMEVPIERLFIVPGNHDIDRTIAERNDAIQRVMFHREGYYDPKYGLIKEQDLVSIHKGNADFLDFLGQVYSDVPGRAALYDDPLVPHFNIVTDDFNILHVDSTLAYALGQEHTDLIIGTKYLQEALASLDSDKPAILLTHYAFTSLLQDEKKYVSEQLYSKGVRLWLAGHEHDHNLQPVKYISSVQAGELRMEERANAAVLLGRYDTESHTGYISAYAWFPEGWAEYPIIWHDYAEENKFPFSLRLPGDGGMSREAVKAKGANDVFADRIPDKVLEALFPDLNVEAGETSKSLLDFIHGIWNTPSSHIIMIAEGGMGKSTMLLFTCQRLLEAGYLCLYVPLEYLVALEYDIRKYMCRILFDGNYERMEKFAGTRESAPSLILMIDGLNELDSENERRFINEVKSLNMLKGIQIVITSRFDFTSRYSMPGYRKVSLSDLRDEQLKKVLTSDEWAAVKDTTTLRLLLSNPMMVTMYKEISPIINRYRGEELFQWTLPIKSSTDLLLNYYVAQEAILFQRTDVDWKKLITYRRCMDAILPFVAYIYESNHRLSFSDGDFNKIIEDAMQNEPTNPEEIRKIGDRFRQYGDDICNVTKWEVLDLLLNELHLLHREHGFTMFPHQIYRDFLSAYWITRHTSKATEEEIKDIWNRRQFSYPIMEHIRNLSGEYWKGVAESVHQAASGRNDAVTMTVNLIECFPWKEGSGIPNYSGLNLRGIPLPDFQLHTEGCRICLENTVIDMVSIGKKRSKPLRYKKLSFSEDNAYLAASVNNEIFIYALQSDEKPFHYDLGSDSAEFFFVGRYLFVKFHRAALYRLLVFFRDGECKEWKYGGEILPAGEDGTLFNQCLRKIILKNTEQDSPDLLYFYYNNREVRYQLPECRIIFSKRKAHHNQESVDGVMLSLKKEFSKSKKKKESGNNNLVASTDNRGLQAVAYKDGLLLITDGKEIQAVLNKGITQLEDAAISGNGRFAATLTSDSFDGYKKIQIWSLDEKSRIGEMYCPGSLQRINLSETGDWIIAEDVERTWLFNTKSKKERWHEGRFISNQNRKLITYDNKALCWNSEGQLCLMDLDTGEIKKADSPCANPALATFMPNGGIAATDQSERTVIFHSSRNKRLMHVNKENACVSGMFFLKQQPFVVVATRNNLICVYHTDLDQRLDHFNFSGRLIAVGHNEKSVIAFTNGDSFQTCNYWEKQYPDKNRGWWYKNRYENHKHPLMGTVLDLAFNSSNEELVVILSNGEIVFCHELYCRYHGNMEIITNFNLDAYDFTGVRCDDKVRDILGQNGAEIG